MTPAPPSRPPSRIERLWKQAGPPLILFIIVVAVWHLAVVVLGIQPFLVPGPLAVGEAIAGNARGLATATLLTAGAALCGFAASLIVGIVIAFIFSQSAWVRRAAWPYAIFLQTVPIVAVAPLIILWFGTGVQSVVVVSFIISLFPVIANATAGLTSVDRALLELFAAGNATRWQTLWKLRLPAAVPYLVAGARTSSGLSVIGAIVGEFFAGYSMTRFGLGYLIIQTSGQLNTPYLFAAILASTALGLAIFGCVSAAGAAVLARWNPSAGE